MFGISKKPHLETYRGFGSKSAFYVLGRVTETIPEYNRSETVSSLQNVKQIVTSYIAKPYKDEEVIVSYNDQDYSVATDSNGFFEITFTPQEVVLQDDAEWIEVSVKLVSTGQEVVTPVLIEGSGNTYGIISDIDDTILVSNVSSKLRLVYNTLTKNAFKRSVFEGVRDLYEALLKGSDGVSTNPIFYVSSSHWNLYHFLSHFFALNELPKGPLLLRTYLSIRTTYKNRKNHDHKKVAIKKVIETYPTLQFVLVGDSGEQDIAIYSEIALEYPNKIKAILIRNISRKGEAVIEQLDESDVAVRVYSANSSADLLAYVKDKGLVV